jgi:prefoldin subunit 5
MNSLHIRIPLFLVLCASLAWSDLQADIEDFRNQKTALQAEIKKLDFRATQTDSIAKDEAKRFGITESRQQQDLERRKGELDALNTRIASLAKELQSEKSSQGNYSSRVEIAKSFRSSVGQKLAEHCADLEGLISHSLPWDRDIRLDRVRALRRDLENANASPEEGLTRLRAIYAEEIRFGDEVVVQNRPMIRSDGETVNARILRIGNMWIVYSDEEESKYGILVPSKNTKGIVEYTWKENLTFNERAAVKLALDVKLARKPPQMVRLPVSLSDIKESK